MSNTYHYIFDTSAESLTKIPDVLEKMNDCLNEFIDKPSPFIAIEMNLPYEDNYPEDLKKALKTLLNYFIVKQAQTKGGYHKKRVFSDVEMTDFYSHDCSWNKPHIQIGGFGGFCGNTIIGIRNIYQFKTKRKYDMLIERMDEIINDIVRIE
tara:strand:- start:2852 stop:3307 length:456 start_codon:yes stop_codon:yes gene_type:complete